MCGIAGYLHFDRSRQSDIDTLTRMTDCLGHRGPDGQGTYVNGSIALGHRRLAIIDLEGGVQPMFNDDRSLVITLNGEIYNYIELREELKALGRSFHTDSDTEVVLQAYEQWGADCQNKLNGMWAFAIWDSRTQRLFLSRDRLGEKPLFYSIHDETIVFASELKSLAAYGVPFRVNSEMIELYLYLTNIPTPYTFYKDVHKLAPGHSLTISGNQVKVQQYWDLPLPDESHMLRDSRKVNERFTELFYDSVRIRMRCDVPFGAFLSGGLDSSSVVAVMSELTRHQVQTFTIGFADKAFDESGLARLVADKFHTSHEILTVQPDSLEQALSKVVSSFGEPFGDSSAIPTASVSRAAASRVKMVLTGDGGDEVLSGYNSYLGLKIAETYRYLSKPVQKLIPYTLKNISSLASKSWRYRLNKMVDVSTTAILPFEERMVRKIAFAGHEQIKQMTDGLQVIRIEDFISGFYSRYPLHDEFYKLMFFDFKHNLPDDYLAKVDRMSMASSLEARLPFLDYRLVEFMSGVDKRVKLRGWKTKTVLRDTIAKKLPDDLLSAPKKGFGVPVREWFKSPAYADRLRELEKMPGLNGKVIAEIIRQNRAGERDNGNFIWSLIVLSEFLKNN